jgi:hypothetical protein
MIIVIAVVSAFILLCVGFILGYATGIWFKEKDLEKIRQQIRARTVIEELSKSDKII